MSAIGPTLCVLGLAAIGCDSQSPLLRPLPPFDASIGPRPSGDASTTDAGPLDVSSPKDTGRSTLDAGPTRLPVPEVFPITADDVRKLVDDTPLPDCRVKLPPPAHSGPDRWLAARGASRAFQSEGSAYLIRVDTSGLGEPRELGPSYMAVDSTNMPFFPVGYWSDDGRFFAFTMPDPNAPDFGKGMRVTDVEATAAPTTWQIDDAQFFGWSPRHTRFLTLRHRRAQIVDAATRAVQAVELPEAVGFSTRWSPDGRYVALYSTEYSYVYVIDADAKVPTLVRHGVENSSLANLVSWSPDSKHFTYVADDASHLLIVKVDVSVSSPAQASTVLSEVDGGITELYYIDDERIALIENNTFTVLDSALLPVAREQIVKSERLVYFRLPGDRCVIHSGACGPDNEPATCVISLDRGASRRPHVLLPAEMSWVQAASNGGRVVLQHTAAQLIVDIVLDGKPYAPLFVTPGGEPAQFQRLGYVVALPDELDAGWVGFTAAPVAEWRDATYFWNRKDQATVPLLVPGINFHDGIFSPDSHYYAMIGLSPEFPPAHAPVVVQALDGANLGIQWALDLRVALNSVTSRELAWQP